MNSPHLSVQNQLAKLTFAIMESFKIDNRWENSFRIADSFPFSTCPSWKVNTKSICPEAKFTHHDLADECKDINYESGNVSQLLMQY